MMSYFTLTIGVLCFCLLQKPTNAQSASYGMWFQPGVKITKFTSTMVVPKVSTGSGFHAVWPGLENDGNSFVYQNVLSDSQSAGKWKFWVEYCCNPDFKHDAVSVSAGDTITSTMSYSGTAWTSSYSITGSATSSGSFTDAAVSTTDAGTMDKALLAIELANGAVWDFGQIQWTNVQITAATTSASWCGQSFTTTGAFTYTVASTANTLSGSSVTCTFGNVLFKAPS